MVGLRCIEITLGILPCVRERAGVHVYVARGYQIRAIGVHVSVRIERKTALANVVSDGKQH
jgi:hypothetical protein